MSKSYRFHLLVLLTSLPLLALATEPVALPSACLELDGASAAETEMIEIAPAELPYETFEKPAHAFEPLRAQPINYF